MKTDRVTRRMMHELALESRGLDGIVRHDKDLTFDSHGGMVQWMREHQDDGYYSMWGTSIEINEVVWREEKVKP